MEVFVSQGQGDSDLGNALVEAELCGNFVHRFVCQTKNLVDIFGLSSPCSHQGLAVP